MSSEKNMDAIERFLEDEETMVDVIEDLSKRVVRLIYGFDEFRKLMYKEMESITADIGRIRAEYDMDEDEGYED